MALGRAGLPADTQLENCSETRFYSGRLDLTQNAGWQIKLQVRHDTGDWGYVDNGQYTEDGDGSRCFNGVPDVQLVFE